MAYGARLMKTKLGMALPLAASVGILWGCVGDEGTAPDGDGSGAFSSAEARLVDFEFDGEVVASSNANPKSQIRAQLLFTVGHLNAEPGVAQLPKVTLTNVTSSSVGGGQYRIAYHASLPVAWGDRDRVPSRYALTLPRRVGSSAASSFVA